MLRITKIFNLIIFSSALSDVSPVLPASYFHICHCVISQCGGKTDKYDKMLAVLFCWSVLYPCSWCSITADMLPPSLSVLQQKNWLNKYTNNFSYFTLLIENTQLAENTTTNSSHWGEGGGFSLCPAGAGYPDLAWQRYHNNTTDCPPLCFVKLHKWE